MNGIPQEARQWIVQRVHGEQSKNDTPAMARLLLEDLADEYYRRFRRELTVDIELVQKEAE